MPETIGEIFRKIVTVLKTQNQDSLNSLNSSLSDINSPTSDVNSSLSDYNSNLSRYNCWGASKEVRRDGLRELIHKYLSEYVTEKQTEELVRQYIP